MGAGGSTSRGSVEDPFPIDPAQNANLDKLSLVAARLLSSSDIYELRNLNKESGCGDYVLFLKDDLPKKLLPFVTEVDVPGGSRKRVTVYYQSPSGAIESKDMREGICRSLMTTMLRTVSIVVACLASMQIKATSREVVMASATPAVKTEEEKKPAAPVDIYQQYAQRQQQYGGGEEDDEAIRWLYERRLIDRTLSRSNPVSDFTAPTSGLPYKMFLYLNEKNHIKLTILDQGVSTAYNLKFLKPIILANGRSVLPVRLTDKVHAQFAGVVLDNGEFMSFNVNTGSRVRFIDLLIMIINKGKHYAYPQYYEPADRVPDASRFFGELEMMPTEDRVRLLQSRTHIMAFVAPIAPPPGMPISPLQPTPPPIFQPPNPFIRGADALFRPAAVATKRPENYLELFFRSFRKKLPRESNPAAVRAETMRGSLDPVSRTLLTRICQDTYWSEESLSKVLGWSTFEFLCTDNWRSLIDQRVNTSFTPELAQFLKELGRIYNGSGVPKLEQVQKEGMKVAVDTLDNYKFTGIANVPFCEEGAIPRIGFREVQAGLKQLQELYAAHTAKVWKILNSLISIVADPATRAETIRLNDAMLKAETSEAYVEERAKEARAVIMEYYIKVEEIYVNTIRAITAARAQS